MGRQANTKSTIVGKFGVPIIAAAEIPPTKKNNPIILAYVLFLEVAILAAIMAPDKVPNA